MSERYDLMRVVFSFDLRGHPARPLARSVFAPELARGLRLTGFAMKSRGRVHGILESPAAHMERALGALREGSDGKLVVRTRADVSERRFARWHEPRSEESVPTDLTDDDIEAFLLRAFGAEQEAPSQVSNQ